MAKPPLAERISRLEEMNEQLFQKINRMKAQVRTNARLIEKLKARQATEQPQPPAPKPQPKSREEIKQEQNDALAAWFANKRKPA